MKKTALIALLLSLCLLLAACGSAAAPASTQEPVPAEVPTPAEDPTPTEEPVALDNELPVRVMVLNGTTGFGMAPLIASSEAGQAALNYSFTVESDASVVTAALVSGEADIAALPTNAASALYNKTQGQVQLLAINTLGVLYLVSDGSVPVESFADLEGQTVYAPAQNPSFIFSYLCAANGVNVSVDNSYAQPAELNAVLSSGEAGDVHLAVLPEPMVTIARSKNQALSVALDLTVEWDKVSEPGSLVQGCLVVQRDFAEAHPAELAAFLTEYEISVKLLLDDPAAGAQAVEAAGVFQSAAVAEKAIPRCNICFVSGEAMKAPMAAFLQSMFETAPQSIGGALPGDDFYYVLK